MGYYREIVGRQTFRTKSHPRNAKDSVILTLSCGHEVRFKGSQEPHVRALCRICRMTDRQN